MTYPGSKAASRQSIEFAGAALIGSSDRLHAMKKLAISILLALVVVAPTFAASLSAKDVAALDAIIDQSNAAFLRSDALGIANVTSERLLQAVGGRDKYIESIQVGMKAVQAQGITIVSHHMDAPTAPILADGFIVAVVKEVTVMASRGRQLRNDGFTVVMRPEHGGAWKLIGGNGVAQNPGVIAMLYPGFPTDYRFPPYTTTPQ